ncbi:hypothetical protein ABG067_006308 [Albugo candida]
MNHTRFLDGLKGQEKSKERSRYLINRAFNGRVEVPLLLAEAIHHRGVCSAINNGVKLKSIIINLPLHAGLTDPFVDCTTFTKRILAGMSCRGSTTSPLPNA